MQLSGAEKPGFSDGVDYGIILFYEKCAAELADYRVKESLYRDIHISSSLHHLDVPLDTR
ncbi:MAG: hypothetical protein ABFD97_13325 [Syntrophobacter sp.]